MAAVDKIKVEYRPIAGLVPYARNARTHSDVQVAEIAKSIERFGFVNPVLVAADTGRIIAGHGRVLGARKLGMDRVPCVVLEGLSEAQQSALTLADNKIALNSGWDEELLRQELQSLAVEGEDLADLGFSEDELTDLLNEESAGSLAIKEINVDDLEDRFWISVRGPLKHQAKALERLRPLIAELDGVEVELGTIGIEP